MLASLSSAHHELGINSPKEQHSSSLTALKILKTLAVIREECENSPLSVCHLAALHNTTGTTVQFDCTIFAIGPRKWLDVKNGI